MNDVEKEDGTIDTTYKDFKLRSVKLMTKNGGQFHSLFVDKLYQRQVAGFAIYESPGLKLLHFSEEFFYSEFIFLMVFSQLKLWSDYSDRGF